MATKSFEELKQYYEELTRQLEKKDFVVLPVNESGKVPVFWENKHLCDANTEGIVFYHQEDIRGSNREKAFLNAANITRDTHEFMRMLQKAPPVIANGLDGDYRLLAEFNNIVFACHPTRFGIQFITWERTFDGQGVTLGHYYEAGSYSAAKEDFATRAGLVQEDKLFSDEQYADIHRAVNFYHDMECCNTQVDEERICDIIAKCERAVPERLAWQDEQQDAPQSEPKM